MNGSFYWRTVRSDRLAFLQNGAAYFPAFVESVRKAKYTVYIAGWDLDSRVALTGRDTKEPLRLGSFLDQIAKARPELNIYLLVWDFSILFAAEREPAPIISLGWKRHPRVHYHADGEHPFGASHHQKFVVVDDSLCFVGGMDIAVRRWDTMSHDPDDPNRVDPTGEPFGPYHDVHSVFDGEGGAVLGEYFRHRWLRATGSSIEKPKTDASVPDEDLWPESVRPLCMDVDVHLARTEPRHKGFPEIREVESMILETIRRAKNHLYIENQYLSSAAVGLALAQRLREDDCPEVLMVLPKKSGSWLARKSMDALRAKTLKDLYEADVNGRLLVRYP
ncbi:MAG: phosphatidylserine synthase, partial [Oceanidesulfovibrio sp.]